MDFIVIRVNTNHHDYRPMTDGNWFPKKRIANVDRE